MALLICLSQCESQDGEQALDRMSVILMAKTDAQLWLKVVMWISGQSANMQIKQVYKLLRNAMIHKHRNVTILRRERSLPHRGLRKGILKEILFKQDYKKWVEFPEIAVARSG